MVPPKLDVIYGGIILLLEFQLESTISETPLQIIICAVRNFMIGSIHNSPRQSPVGGQNESWLKWLIKIWSTIPSWGKKLAQTINNITKACDKTNQTMHTLCKFPYVLHFLSFLFSKLVLTTPLLFDITCVILINHCIHNLTLDDIIQWDGRNFMNVHADSEDSCQNEVVSKCIVKHTDQ